jgi:WhiB family redox-sensing transcriptional regulator
MTESTVPSLGSWCDSGLCKGMSKIFYASIYERPSQKKRREYRAKMICARCPVIEQCQAYARANPEYGVWGGETEEERYLQGFPVPVGSRARYRRRIKRMQKRVEL